MTRHLSIALIASATLAACGGDDSNTLSRSEYIRRADAACNRSLPQPIRGASIVDKAPSIDRAATAREKALKEAAKLDPPDELRAPVDRYLATTRDVIAGERKKADAGRAGQATIFEAFDVDASLAQALRVKAAVEIGFRRCGQPVSGPPSTSAEYLDPKLIEQADAACRKATAFARAQQPTQTNDFRSLGEDNAAIAVKAREALVTLKTLDPPAKQREQWDAFLKRFEQRVGNSEELGKAGKANDSKAYLAAGHRDKRHYQQELAIATRLGFAVCGRASALGV